LYIVYIVPGLMHMPLHPEVNSRQLELGHHVTDGPARTHQLRHYDDADAREDLR
jgi:hypothetical protein